MIDTSSVHKKAVVADVRETDVLIPIRIISPTAEYVNVEGSTASPVSKNEQVFNGVVELTDNYATLENKRWVLDGTFGIVEDDYSYEGEVGYVSDALSDENGYYTPAQEVTLRFTGIPILQATTIYFPGSSLDGIPVDFEIYIMQGGTVYYQEAFYGNASNSVSLSGFTVYNPDAVKVTISKWSIPYRRARIAEVYPGYAADWTSNDITTVTVKMRVDVSNLSVPYGAATITLDNSNGIFDPRNKSGLFQSLEERQQVPIQFRVGTKKDGMAEYVPAGVYYQHDRGWSTGSGRSTIKWDLIDIVGLIVDTTFFAPDVLPTTLVGWVEALCSSLGDEFAERYTVDQDYASISLTASREDVQGKSCGDILKWICQATGTFPRADAETGKLAVEPFWSQGNEYNLDNVNDVPTVSANDEIAMILFKLESGDFVVSGNTSTSKKSVTVKNPFVKTQEDALFVARNILTAYGGNRISVTGRGDPSSEVGDVSTIELDENVATTARMYSQYLNYSNGMLRNCKMEFLQSDGYLLYENCEVITESGTWTAPQGVTSVYLILIGGGQAGGRGADGTLPSVLSVSSGWCYGERGERGETGSGCKVWYGRITINDGQSFNVHVGAGGVAGDTGAVDGEATTFGAYTSENGHTYSPSFTDISSGRAYGRSGVPSPVENTGDGGVGGIGGEAGAQYYVQVGEHQWELKKTVSPGTGRRGVDGASGCVVVYWNVGG